MAHDMKFVKNDPGLRCVLPDFDAAVNPGKAKSARIDLGFFIVSTYRKMKPFISVTVLAMLLLFQVNASIHYYFSPTRFRVDPYLILPPHPGLLPEGEGMI